MHTLKFAISVFTDYKFVINNRLGLDVQIVRVVKYIYIYIFWLLQLDFSLHFMFFPLKMIPIQQREVPSAKY